MFFPWVANTVKGDPKIAISPSGGVTLAIDCIGETLSGFASLGEEFSNRLPTEWNGNPHSKSHIRGHIYNGYMRLFFQNFRCLPDS